MPLPTEPPHSDNLDLNPFKVQSRREIIALLRAIGEHRQLIRLLMEGSGEAAVTSILQLDEATDSLIFDAALDPVVNAHLLSSTNISFETVLDRIQIVFFASRIESCLYERRPALCITLPASLIRMQRREFYRVPTPIIAPLRCAIHVIDDGGSHSVSLPLQNVSGGGIGIIDDKHLLDHTIGRIYKHCQIHLPDNTVIITTLEIRNVNLVRLDGGKTTLRVGCLFVGLPKPMLTVIQRYISKLERESNARQTGAR